MPAKPSEHITLTIYQLLWGSKLSSHPFTFEDDPVNFSSLWSDKRHFVEIYKEANLEQGCYDLCSLLAVTNSIRCLTALLKDGAIHVNHSFGADFGNMTLAHLACALGSADFVEILLNQKASQKGIWAITDDENQTAIDVCFSKELRKSIPNPGKPKKTLTRVTLTTENREKIFKLAAQQDAFYKVIVQLQKFVFDVNKERNTKGDLLIHIAVKGGLPSLPLLLALVNIFKADVAARNADGLTPLCLAAKHGEKKVAEVLVCVLGADINCPEEKNHSTPLHLAVQNNHIQVVKMLVCRGADTNQEDKNKQVPLYLAQWYQAHECQKEILQHQQDRTESLAKQAVEGTLLTARLYPSDLCQPVNSDGYTLLMLAAQHNHEALLQELVVKMETECSINYKLMKLSSHFPESCHTCKTAVHFAAEKGHTGCLKILLGANAHPSIQDFNKWLPLHYACNNGHVECVRTIISHFLGLCGLKLALDLATKRGYREIVAILRDAHTRRQKELVAPMLFKFARTGHKDQLKVLIKELEDGDDVNPTNESGDWPLFLAAREGYLEVIIELQKSIKLDHLSPASRNLEVMSAIVKLSLLLSMWLHKEDTVMLYLLNFCHPWNSQTTKFPHSSSTPIVGLGETMQYLDINQRNAAGATPLELATSQGHLNVVKLLLDHGASTTLPDSMGRPLRSDAFHGIQVLIENHRKERMRKITNALVHRTPLKEFEKIWHSPSDLNLRNKDGDTFLMVAAQKATTEIFRFLIQSAASCKPGILLSPSRKALLLQCSLSSMEESDLSDQSLPAMPLTHCQPHHQRTYSLESSGECNGKTNCRHPHKQPHPWLKSVSSATATESSGEEKEEEGRAERPGPIAANNGPHIDIIRLTSLHDGQTALHRAANSDQHKIVSLLLNEDPQCANIQDTDGNTALHQACRKAHKNTIKTLLNYACVSSSITNCKRELPEDVCPNRGIKEKVRKHRESQVKQSFSSPPVTPIKSNSGEFFQPNMPPRRLSPVANGDKHGPQGLSGNPESTETQTDFTEICRRFEQLKAKHEQ